VAATAQAARRAELSLEPGVVLTYVMHSFDNQADWEFNSVVVAVTPEETEFAVDATFKRPDGTLAPGVYHRRQSRREAMAARTIDHAGSCSPTDTTDTRYRNSTLLMVSQRVFRELSAGDPSEVHLYYSPPYPPRSCEPGMRIPGVLRRVEAGTVGFPLLVDGSEVTVPALHVRGTAGAVALQLALDYWFLDDPFEALLLRVDGVRRGPGSRDSSTFRQQLVRVDHGAPGRQADLAWPSPAREGAPSRADAQAGTGGTAGGRASPGERPAGTAATGADSGRGGGGGGGGGGGSRARGAGAGSGSALGAALERSCRTRVYGIYFAFGSAELRPPSEAALGAIASVMRQHPDWVITIEGHTDSIGGAASNQVLSKRRAAAVRDALVRRHGIPAARLVARGFGLTRPIAPNATLEGRARNRRVELARQC
jgi:outer membrane protein OmpA-like peptidoglycan-associated protein